jgi:hypothetical protein
VSLTILFLRYFFGQSKFGLLTFYAASGFQRFYVDMKAINADTISFTAISADVDSM